MSFAKASRKAEDIKQGGTAYIVGSGMYPVTVLAAIVNTSAGGSESVDMYVDHQGQKQVIYGNLRVTNNDGTPNKIGAKIFNQLLIISGLDEVADPVEMELPIGKKESMKTVAVLQDLEGLEVLMRVQMEYSVYNGGIQEKKNIKAFFRAEDKATAEEIVHEEKPGVGYERDMKYVDNVTYKDGLTPEAIQAWISGGRTGTAKGATGGAGNADKTAKAPSFGSKRRFGKKNEEEAAPPSDDPEDDIPF